MPGRQIPGTPAPGSYESLYRRSVLAVYCILGALLVLSAMVAFVIFSERGKAAATMFPLALAAVAAIVLLIWVLMAALRMHCWTLEADGIRIEERPRVRFTGLRRHAKVTFKDIVALRRMESGFDTLIEIAARDGSCYRLSQAFARNERGVGIADLAGLETFVDAVRAAAQRAGATLPVPEQALSYWNRPVGLAVLAVIFAASLVIAGGAAWSLWQGIVQVRPRSGEMTAILIMLPVGAGWLFLRVLKRRRAVLAARGR